MEEIKLIIEQYEKRLHILKNTKGLDIIADTRLRTKASCYRSIISELKRCYLKNAGEQRNLLISFMESLTSENITEIEIAEFEKVADRFLNK